MNSLYHDLYNIDNKLLELAKKSERKCFDAFNRINKVKEYNQLKVIKAFQNNRVSESHFTGTTGYGYDDRGRDILDKVFAEIFGAEDALVRYNIVSGTQALASCLFGVLRPGDKLLTITGKPYDTLEEVIGIRGNGSGSLKDFNVDYDKIDLLDDGSIDINFTKERLDDSVKVVMIQRSRGYEWRKAISIEEIEKVIKEIKSIKHDVIILVDNCYGEFVSTKEPTEVGADIMAGSLIKNPGGGLAETGGYIAGKEKYIDLIAQRLTAPGIGREVGASLGHNRLIYQGLYFAPHVVSEGLKGAVFTATFMESLGFIVNPSTNEYRSDIIQAIRFKTKEQLIQFCQGIQMGSPIDSYVLPHPWDMPGYENQVIMAAGTFIQGATSELSADAPIREPYTAYMQGGLVYENVKLAVLISAQRMQDRGNCAVHN